MIATSIILWFSLATAIQPNVMAVDTVHQANQSKATVSSATSFEEISKAAIRARDEERDDDAIRFFEQSLKLKPDWDDGLWYLATLFYEKDQFRESRDLLRHYLAQNPKQGPGWALLGICDYKLREYERALEHLQMSTSLGLEGRKQLADTVFYDKAILLIREGQFEAGIKLLYMIRGDAGASRQGPLEVPAGLSALNYQLLPEEVPSARLEYVRMLGRAVFARLDQQREKAKSILGDLEREHPNEKGVHYQYGTLLLEENSPQGVEEMQKVLAISPSNTEARLQLAEYYLVQSQAEKGRPYVDEVLNLEPSHPIGHMLKGEILAATGNNSDAISELELATKLAPEDSKVLWALMHAYTAAGRRDDAARVKAEIEKMNVRGKAVK